MNFKKRHIEIADNMINALLATLHKHLRLSEYSSHDEFITINALEYYGYIRKDTLGFMKPTEKTQYYFDDGGLRKIYKARLLSRTGRIIAKIYVAITSLIGTVWILIQLFSFLNN